MSAGPLDGGRSSRSFFAELLRGHGLDPGEVPNQFDLAHYDQMRETFAGRFVAKAWAESAEVFADDGLSVTPMLNQGDPAVDEYLRAWCTVVPVEGVDRAAPAPRLAHVPALAGGAPPQRTTAGDRMGNS